jgi:SAM-dependent methyltransferase
MVAAAFQRFLALPWVFEFLRPLVLGGLNFAEAYRLLAVDENDTVLDVGCGMGDALRYLGRFAEYHGFDMDAKAIDVFQRRCSHPGVHLHARRCDPEDLDAIKPTKVILIGLLHHVGDREVIGLLEPLARTPDVRLPGFWTNNLLARLDRGRFVRTAEQYEALAADSGWEIRHRFWISTGWRLASYYGMVLERVPGG